MAARMSDEDFEAKCGALHRAPVYAEARRARESEAALLEAAREALGELRCYRTNDIGEVVFGVAETIRSLEAAIAQSEGR